MGNFLQIDHPSLLGALCASWLKCKEESLPSSSSSVKSSQSSYSSSEDEISFLFSPFFTRDLPLDFFFRFSFLQTSFSLFGRLGNFIKQFAFVGDEVEMSVAPLFRLIIFFFWRWFYIYWRVLKGRSTAPRYRSASISTTRLCLSAGYLVLPITCLTKHGLN